MKKFYLMALAAMSVMAMSSCSSDEPNVGPEFSNTAINFGSYLGRDAEERASITTGAKDFGVFAFYTGNTAWENYDSASKTTPNFMNNQQVTGEKSNAGEWSYTYTPVKYWPNNDNDKLSFFAYSPYDANTQWKYDASQNAGYLTYTVQQDVKKQQDFLACLNSDATVDVTKQDDRQKVNFLLKHTLSRIGIKVKYMDDESADNQIAEGTTIKIDTVKIGDDAEGSGFYQTGKLKLDAKDKVEWFDCTGNQSYTLSSDNFMAKVANSVTNSYQKLNADDSYIMLFPQDFSKKSLEIMIVYTVTTQDSNEPDKKVTIQNSSKKKININLQAGKAYTFNLCLGLNSVQIGADVDSWSPKSDGTDEYPQD